MKYECISSLTDSQKRTYRKGDKIGRSQWITLSQYEQSHFIMVKGDDSTVYSKSTEPDSSWTSPAFNTDTDIPNDYSTSSNFDPPNYDTSSSNDFSSSTDFGGGDGGGGGASGSFD